MKTDNTDAQEALLRKVLAFKRIEAPPPGYFDGFATKVINRIEADQAKGVEAWWRRLLGFVRQRPLTASYYGALSVVLVALTLAVTQSSEADLASHPEAFQGVAVLEATLAVPALQEGDWTEAATPEMPLRFEESASRSALAPAFVDFSSPNREYQQVSYSF